MVRHCSLTVHPLAGQRKAIQAIPLEARLSLAGTVILQREEEKKKKEEKPDGRRKPNPAEAEVSTQRTAGLQARRVLNKC